jgi:hypothetical protein
MQKTPAIAAWIVMGLLTLVLWNCGGSGSFYSRNVSPDVSFRKIAVVPYSIVRAPLGQVMVSSPITGDMFRTGPVETWAEEVMTDLLMQRLGSNPRYHLVSRPTVADSIEAILSNARAEKTRGQLAKMGKQFGADGILIGFIYVFRDRVGKSYSVESPASVSFDLYLLRADTGRLVWKAGYTRTQQPVTSNVLDLHDYAGGLRWLTATQLAEVGFKQMFEKYPHIKWENQ